MPSGVDPTQNIIAPGETPLISQPMRQFRGVNTKAARSAIDADQFYDLENIIPLGNANLHTVADISASLFDFTTHTVYAAQFGMVASVPYLFCYTADGDVYAYNLNANTGAKINGAFTLSSANVRSVPWYNTYQLFIDSTGYYAWDGTIFSQLSLADGPSAGSDITVYAGRVWVSNGRLITYTAVYVGTSATDPTVDTAWLASNGGGFLNMTDPSLVGNITRLWQQNGFLYILGGTCVYALSDIYVPAGASPPTPVYTLTAVQSIIGSNMPFSVFPYNRMLMFANMYGAWAIEGVNAEQISEDLDGTWQYLSPASAISGGQCIVNNKLCAGFLIERLDDPIFGNTTVVAMWFDGKWWFANYGNITFVAPVVLSNSTPALMAFIGNKLHRMFDTSVDTLPETKVMTPLWDLGDPFSDKQVLRAGIELITQSFTESSTINATIDTFNGSTPFGAISTIGQIVFVNNVGNPLQFQGSGSANIYWTVGTYQLYQGPTPGQWAKYVGMTFNTTGVAYEMDSFLMDFKKRKRW